MSRIKRKGLSQTEKEIYLLNLLCKCKKKTLQLEIYDLLQQHFIMVHRFVSALYYRFNNNCSYTLLRYVRNHSSYRMLNIRTVSSNE